MEKNNMASRELSHSSSDGQGNPTLAAPDVELVECPACLGNGFSEEPARFHGRNVHSACRTACDACDGSGSVPA